MNDTKTMVEKQRSFFKSGRTKEVDFRREQLRILRKAIIRNEAAISNALKEDLNKSPFEAYATEIGIILDELKHVLKHVSSWAKPESVRTPIVHFLSSSRIFKEPYGLVLIMSPWNYPFQLTMAPLLGSIAAGNCSIIKPSAYSPNTAEIIEKIIKESFDESYITVIQGGRNANRSLLDEKFDYIFFTGSVSVGKTVMEAASKHLTPVTLELGGKSPCIVLDDVNVGLAARRIVWGKLLNAGQTCIAPDYILVQRKVKDELAAEMGKQITRFYGKDPCSNPEYPKIINDKHFKRLLNLMKSGNIVFGGESDKESGKICPTIIDGVTWKSPIMQEEIFGPLLPVLEFDNLDEAVSQVNEHPKPLALYLFTNNKKNQQYVLNSTSFGGGCINDTIVHLATSNMPFGGVGNSGMGAYHGKASFDTFSHKKSILKKSNLIDIPLRYPPYKNHLKLLKKMMG